MGRFTPSSRMDNRIPRSQPAALPFRRLACEGNQGSESVIVECHSGRRSAALWRHDGVTFSKTVQNHCSLVYVQHVHTLSRNQRVNLDRRGIFLLSRLELEGIEPSRLRITSPPPPRVAPLGVWPAGCPLKLPGWPSCFSLLTYL